jgi:hypothetical protein
VGPASSRARRVGRQSHSNASHTGRQYCGRFHHHFLDLLVDQPLGKEAQLAGRRTEWPAFKVPVPLDFHVRHHHRQHRFVHVDSCDSIGHTHLPGRERRTCLDGLTQGHRLSHDDAHLFAQARTFRIIQYDGVRSSIV